VIVSDQCVSGSPSPQERLVTVPGAWRYSAPLLRGRGVTLRETEHQDALVLFTVLSSPQLARAILLPPRSPAELAARISSAAVDRRNGRGIWLSVIRESGAVAGIFRVREVEPGFGSAEWEFALAHEQWGGGLFFHVAPMVVDFVFDVLGARRLEGRVALPNARGQAALRKLGAVQEAVLRQSLRADDGVSHDQVLLTLLAEDWRSRWGRDAIH
jgi:RimJ/RimL family protein N-acetyltransferase